MNYFCYVFEMQGKLDTMQNSVMRRLWLSPITYSCRRFVYLRFSFYSLFKNPHFSFLSLSFFFFFLMEKKSGGTKNIDLLITDAFIQHYAH